MASRLIKLPSSGAIFAVDELIAIVMQDLNVYGFIIRNCPVVLKGDGNDVDFFVEHSGSDLVSKALLEAANK